MMSMNRGYPLSREACALVSTEFGVSKGRSCTYVRSIAAASISVMQKALIRHTIKPEIAVTLYVDIRDLGISMLARCVSSAM
jgi:hypothetical protein